jgi:hypothetical protein
MERMSYELVNENERDPNKVSAKGTFLLYSSLERDFGANIDLAPDLAPDVFGLGEATHFDSAKDPGYVWVWFSNGNMLRVPIDMFKDLRFKLDENMRDGDQYVFQSRGFTKGMLK